MPEDFLLNHTFVAISTDAVSPVATTIAIAISTDDTKLFWDHWEDGYEADATNPSSKTTQIWGDGDPSNGCVPTKPCTAAGDKLFADDVIILNNDVPTPRNKANIFYDGGDRLQASYPVTVTRSAFPRNPGSHMAGAVEVSAVGQRPMSEAMDWSTVRCLTPTLLTIGTGHNSLWDPIQRPRRRRFSHYAYTGL